MEADVLCGIIREVWCKLVCCLISYRRSRVAKIKILLNVTPRTEKNDKSTRTVEFVLNLRNVSSSTDVPVHLTARVKFKYNEKPRIGINRAENKSWHKMNKQVSTEVRIHSLTRPIQ